MRAPLPPCTLALQTSEEASKPRLLEPPSSYTEEHPTKVFRAHPGRERPPLVHVLLVAVLCLGLVSVPWRLMSYAADSGQPSPGCVRHEPGRWDGYWRWRLPRPLHNQPGPSPAGMHDGVFRRRHDLRLPRRGGGRRDGILRAVTLESGSLRVLGRLFFAGAAVMAVVDRIVHATFDVSGAAIEATRTASLGALAAAAALAAEAAVARAAAATRRPPLFIW